MSTPIELRNERLAKKLIENLKRRNFEAFFCPTSKEMIEKVLELIPVGSSISWGGSMSIRETGLTNRLKEGLYKVFDRDDAKTEKEKNEIYRKAFECDYFLSSVNAMSENGVIVNVDGNGNRVAAITWGPEKVIFIVGMNKVVQNVDAALVRARSFAAPVNATRLDIKTPCQTDGICHNCNSKQSICNYIHFLRNSYPEKRHIVILVGENLGY